MEVKLSCWADDESYQPSAIGISRRLRLRLIALPYPQDALQSCSPGSQSWRSAGRSVRTSRSLTRSRKSEERKKNAQQLHHQSRTTNTNNITLAQARRRPAVRQLCHAQGNRGPPQVDQEHREDHQDDEDCRLHQAHARSEGHDFIPCLRSDLQRGVREGGDEATGGR